ncbi:hypothetical protein KAR91_22865 [Candidatus Pacearchaeota archaeon]|nr:hypothetical protein [Candidatus Pacearchaeota archaeon]
MTETRSQFKQRLTQEGKWEKFLELREEYKRQGLIPKDATMRAKDEVENIKTDCVVSDFDSGFITDDGDSADGLVGKHCFTNSGNISERQIVRWIFDNIGITDIGPEDAPNSGAWSYLQSLRNSPTLLQDFYRNVWTKMLPSKSEIENARKFEDDGREQLNLIDRIEQASRDAVL